MKTETFQKIYILTTLILLAFLCFIVYYIHENREGLLEDPLIYGLNKRFPNNDVNCICEVITDTDHEGIMVNKTDIRYLNNRIYK